MQGRIETEGIKFMTQPTRNFGCHPTRLIKGEPDGWNAPSKWKYGKHGKY